MLCAALLSCEFRKEKNGTDPLVDQGILGRVSYNQVRERVFVPYCTSCHGSLGGVNLESYEAVIRNLPAVNRRALVERTMPKGGSLPTQESVLLATWIEAGAPESVPGSGQPEASPTPMPPMIPTYASIKQHIIDLRCVGCHRTSGAAAGVPLATFRELLDSPRELVLPQNPDESGLVIAISRDDAKRMPPPSAGGALTAEEIQTIRTWIQNGAPEN